MQGISDRALQFGKWNRYQYNGIEHDTTFGIDDYEAKLRDLDDQTGRWWQIDPKSENTEDISPYASNNNNPIRYKDPNGDAACDPCITAPVEEWVNSTADEQAEIAPEAHLVGAVVIGVAMLWDASMSSDAPVENVSITGVPNSVNQMELDYFQQPNSITPIAIPQPVDLSGQNPAVQNRPYNLLLKPMAQVQAKAQSQTAPGQTSAGHPTDVHGNKLGPSGKPQVNNVRHPSQKAAKDAARNEGDGAPVKHPSPAKGNSHYHPTKGGEKVPNSTHHEY